MSNHSPESLARAVCAAHDVYVAAVLAFRKLPSRETRQLLDEAAIRHADLMMVLFDPARPYVPPRQKGRKPSVAAEDVLRTEGPHKSSVEIIRPCATENSEVSP